MRRTLARIASVMAHLDNYGLVAMWQHELQDGKAHSRCTRHRNGRTQTYLCTERQRHERYVHRHRETLIDSFTCIVFIIKSSFGAIVEIKIVQIL